MRDDQHRFPMVMESCRRDCWGSRPHGCWGLGRTTFQCSSLRGCSNHWAARQGLAQSILRLWNWTPCGMTRAGLPRFLTAS